jgi:hypothetical protein
MTMHVRDALATVFLLLLGAASAGISIFVRLAVHV